MSCIASIRPVASSSVDATSSYLFIHLSQSSFALGAIMLVEFTVSTPFRCANARAPEETKVLHNQRVSVSKLNQVDLGRQTTRSVALETYKGRMRPSLSGTRACARIALASLIGFLTPVCYTYTHARPHTMRQSIRVHNDDAMQRIFKGIRGSSNVGQASGGDYTSDQRIVARGRWRKDVPSTAPTLPKSPVRPSMMAASHSTVPWNVKLEP